MRRWPVLATVLALFAMMFAPVAAANAAPGDTAHITSWKFVQTDITNNNYQPYDLEVEWEADVQSGATNPVWLQFALPPEIKGQLSSPNDTSGYSITLKDDNNVTSGSCDITLTDVKCTVDPDYVTGHPDNIKGTFWLKVRVEMGETLGSNPVSRTLELDGKAYTFNVKDPQGNVLCDPATNANGCKWPGSLDGAKRGSYQDAQGTIFWTVDLPTISLTDAWAVNSDHTMPAGLDVVVVDNFAPPADEIVEGPTLTANYCWRYNGNGVPSPAGWYVLNDNPDANVQVTDGGQKISFTTIDPPLNVNCGAIANEPTTLDPDPRPAPGPAQGGTYRVTWRTKNANHDLGGKQYFENVATATINGVETKPMPWSFANQIAGGTAGGDMRNAIPQTPQVSIEPCTDANAGQTVWEKATTPSGGYFTYTQTEENHVVTVKATPVVGAILTKDLPAGTPGAWTANDDGTATWTYTLQSQKCAPNEVEATPVLPTVKDAVCTKPDEGKHVWQTVETNDTDDFTYTQSTDANHKVTVVAKPAAGKKLPATLPAGWTANGDGSAKWEKQMEKLHCEEPKVSIGDYVWWDTDRDGLQSTGEDPVPGVTVNLYKKGSDTVLKTDVTDDKGYYSFTDLDRKGEYVVEFVKPADTSFTTQNVLSNGKDAEDSDADPVTGKTSVTAPAEGENLGDPGKADDPTIDAGLVKYNLVLEKQRVGTEKVYLGSTVTFTLVPSNEGPVDALAGWSVTDVLPEGLTLVKMEGDGYDCKVATATCVNNAPFEAKTSGKPITVTATVDVKTKQTLVNVAYVSPAPEDIAETNPLEVPKGQTKTQPPTNTKTSETDNDAEAPVDTDSLVSIGDYVWFDHDRDGKQGDTEPVVEGMTVKLYEADGKTPVGETKTDDKGFYSFVDLVPGKKYVVEFVKPEGTSFTTQNTGDDDTKDSDADRTTGRVEVIAPATGENSKTRPDDPTIDAGLVKFNLKIVKTLTTAGVVHPGDTVRFTLVPSNDGPSDSLGGWSVTELLPAGLTLAKLEGEGYSCDLATATCVNAQALKAGESGKPIVVTATVNAGVTGKLKNVAYVTPNPEDVPEDNPLEVPTKDTDTVKSPTDNDYQAVVTVTPPPALTNTGGAPPYPVMGAAAGLLLLGAAAFGLARRRARQERAV